MFFFFKRLKHSALQYQTLMVTKTAILTLH